MNITNILNTLLIGNDLLTANNLSRSFFNKSVIKAIKIPDEAKIWFICCDSRSETEQLFVLRKALFDLRVLYDWIPPLSMAEKVKLRGVGIVYALPIPAAIIKANPEFITNMENSHPLLRLIKRRK